MQTAPESSVLPQNDLRGQFKFVKLLPERHSQFGAILQVQEDFTQALEKEQKEALLRGQKQVCEEKQTACERKLLGGLCVFLSFYARDHCFFLRDRKKGWSSDHTRLLFSSLLGQLKSHVFLRTFARR